jgi:hypothetical protein
MGTETAGQVRSGIWPAAWVLISVLAIAGVAILVVSLGASSAPAGPSVTPPISSAVSSSPPSNSAGVLTYQQWLNDLDQACLDAKQSGNADQVQADLAAGFLPSSATAAKRQRALERAAVALDTYADPGRLPTDPNQAAKALQLLSPLATAAQLTHTDATKLAKLGAGQVDADLQRTLSADNQAVGTYLLQSIANLSTAAPDCSSS